MDESGQLHTPATFLAWKEPPKPTNRNLGAPHIKVEDFNFKFTSIVKGCRPQLKKLGESFKISKCNRPNKNWTKLYNKKSHDAHSLPNIMLIREDEMDGVCGTHEDQK
jgi:hypothetical protein